VKEKTWLHVVLSKDSQGGGLLPEKVPPSRAQRGTALLFRGTPPRFVRPSRELRITSFRPSPCLRETLIKKTHPIFDTKSVGTGFDTPLRDDKVSKIGVPIAELDRRAVHGGLGAAAVGASFSGRKGMPASLYCS
jgi:hypothetical protein